MTNNEAALIDAYLQATADLAKAKLRLDDLREQILELGEGAHEGEVARVTVSRADRENVAWKAVAEKAGASRQLITAHTKYTEVWTVKCVARTGEDLDVAA